VSQGPNNTTIVVTDAFGRRQTYSNYFYGADTLLAKGLSDFSYSFGVLHSQFGEQVGHGAAAAGRYSVGITNNITGGGRMEFSQSTLSGGPAFTFRLAHGVLGTGLAVSHSGSQNGSAALISYQYMDPNISGGLALTFQSPHYSTLALQPYQDRNLLNAQFSIAKQLGAGRSISLSYYRQNDRDNGPQGVWQLSQVAQLSESLQLQLGESLTSSVTGKQFGLQTSLSFIPRHGLAASLNASQSGGQTQTTLQVQRALDSGTPSFGYTVSASAGTGAVSEYASAEYRAQYGDYIANLGTGAGQSSMQLTAAGGLVFIDGHFFPTQSISDSYALVDTGGLGHVRVLANNIVVGRTNKHGYLLVPQLGSYLNNEIAIASNDTPIDYNIEESQQEVAPLYRSGAIVRFGINKVQPVTGALLVHLAGKNVIPAFGIIEVDNGTSMVRSDIGEGGEFYFDRLSTGVHHARITFEGGQCGFDLTVPQSAAHFIKLGTVTCQNGVRS
jgi:outer membrane usher protein